MYDCDTCTHGVTQTTLEDGRAVRRMVQGPQDEYTRRTWHCGWMDERYWVWPMSLPSRVIGSRIELGIEGVRYEGDVCPGWAVRQPMIEEIAQAHLAFEKGNLEAVFPELAQCVADGVLDMSRAFSEYEQRRMAMIEAEQEAKDRKGR